mmetsp:Transcript_39904/g.99892  ORF Transcript_39904/g.99892 Transcript_39904/m.99892 type:complete len:210 (+) Transcript_39904:1626-2255(+)
MLAAMAPSGSRVGDGGKKPLLGLVARVSSAAHDALAHLELPASEPDWLAICIRRRPPRLDHTQDTARVIPRLEWCLVLNEASNRALSHAPVLDHSPTTNLRRGTFRPKRKGRAFGHGARDQPWRVCCRADPILPEGFLILPLQLCLLLFGQREGHRPFALGGPVLEPVVLDRDHDAGARVEPRVSHRGHDRLPLAGAKGKPHDVVFFPS